MIQVGDMVGFEFRGDYHLAIIMEDLGRDYPYGRYTGLLVGSDGDYIPLSDDEITLLSTKTQVDGWERQKKLQKLLDKKKQTSYLIV